MATYLHARRRSLAVLLWFGLLAALALMLALPARGQETVDVSVQNFSFSPSVVNIEAGDTVRWTNEGGFHNVSSTTPSMSFRCANGCDGEGGNGDPASNAWTASVTFDTVGTFTYICEVHGAPPDIGMAGTVNVAEPTAVGLSSIFASGSTNANLIAAVLLLMALGVLSLYLATQRLRSD